MNLSFFDSLRPVLSRIIGGLVGGAAAYATSKTGIEVSADMQTAISGAVLIGVSGVTHKVLDKWINPGDSASTHLAVSEKIEAADLKR